MQCGVCVYPDWLFQNFLTFTCWRFGVPVNGVPQGGDMGGWRITWMLEDGFVASNQMQVQACLHRN